MSNRSIQGLAAQTLRHGLVNFWPTPESWLQGGFINRISDEAGHITEQRCVEQMITDSIKAMIHTSVFDVTLISTVRLTATRALAQAAGLNADSSLLGINDAPDATYEKMKALVEKAALELESVA